MKTAVKVFGNGRQHLLSVEPTDSNGIIVAINRPVITSIKIVVE